MFSISQEKMMLLPKTTFFSFIYFVIYSLFMNKINLIRKQESWRPFKVGRFRRVKEVEEVDFHLLDLSWKVRSFRKSLTQFSRRDGRLAFWSLWMIP